MCHTPECQCSCRCCQNSILSRLTARAILTPDNCLEWTGRLNRYGYGVITVAGVKRTVHRVAYEHFVGPIAAGLVIDHTCRSRSCLNPLHLEAVTTRENTRRGWAARGWITHCRRGHSMDDAYARPDGYRTCRPCVLERQRARRAAQRS